MKAAYFFFSFEWNKVATVNIAHKTYDLGELIEKLDAK